MVINNQALPWPNFSFSIASTSPHTTPPSFTYFASDTFFVKGCSPITKGKLIFCSVLTQLCRFLFIIHFRLYFCFFSCSILFLFLYSSLLLVSTFKAKSVMISLFFSLSSLRFLLSDIFFPTF